MTMPPIPLEYAGRGLVADFLRAVVYRPGLAFHVVPTRANGQLALAVYVREPGDEIQRGTGVLVYATTPDGQVSAITRFDESVLPSFNLPATLS
jgi:RNA polymerase sigma-70 factor (ECF subfamily)